MSFNVDDVFIAKQDINIKTCNNTILKGANVTIVEVDESDHVLTYMVCFKWNNASHTTWISEEEIIEWLEK